VDASAAETKRVEVGDGRAVLIGPLHPSDRGRFLDGMGRASQESFYKRFMTPIPRLTSKQIAYLMGVDHHDHEALLAVDEDSGEAVAIGRFVRDAERPACAEAAILVIDDWHGLGLGKALTRALSDRARELGIDRFEATMLTDNKPMLAVLRDLGEVRTRLVDGSTLFVEVDLPEPEPAERITGTMRVVGDDRYELEE
jgi:GNAT superfamily N-acetyltransferase